MIGLLLLAIQPALGGVWRWCSGAAFVIVLQFCIGSVKVFRRFDPQKLQRRCFVGISYDYAFGD
jgi:hypothetical protein